MKKKREIEMKCNAFSIFISEINPLSQKAFAVKRKCIDVKI